MPTYNSLEITFTNDWVDYDKLYIVSTTGGTTTIGDTWEWVSPARTLPFEVRTGTPTGTAGERAAIQFKIAFDLDFASGYTVTQVSNVVTIESETAGEDWGIPSAGFSNTGQLTYVIDNGSTPAPVADFTGTPLSGQASLSVAFTDTSTNTPTSWAWTFGDGGTSTQQNPTKIYTNAGTYDVGLTATNAGGSDIETKVGYVVVSAAPPPTPTTIELMLARSPYYVYLPFVYSTTTAATIELKIWEGDLNIPPASATETLTKTRPSVDFAEFNIDIAKAVRDQLSPKPTIDLTSSSQIVDSDVNSVKWVSFVASYTDAVETIDDITGSFVACDGFGYMQEGVNPSKPSDSLMSSVTFRKVDRNGFIMLPFVNDETITSFDVDSDLGNINDTLTPTSTTQNEEYIQYVCVDVSQATTDDNIVITANPGGETFTYQITDECRYTPTNVVFKNKFGCFENITMFKKRKDTLTTKKEQFKNNYISGGTYDTSKHQIKDLNVIGNEKVSLNTGYQTEAENELVKQLLLSDDVYFYENDTFVPVRITTSTQEFKTRTNDTVINYTLDFEYAFNTINNI